ncbi:glycosyltransferase [Sporosarcina jeotgali]|uniref:Glycosyltransferase n=1 Tax=Sporosarcina jeotgali TaxID=3020056 RepID=A0ABZ0KX21_9BACL|nr:glycosyltransferase [Sporosarcina sp. B2O-1]WOV84515.1 glycosyltransferase [Sporosarcina sp. B2O-1]
MNILFITHRKPEIPGKGDQVRAYQQIRSLVNKGHTVHCLYQENEEASWCCGSSLLNGVNDEKYKMNAKNNRFSILRSFLFKGYPLSVSLASFPILNVLLERILSETQYDVIHVQSKMLHNFQSLNTSGSKVIVDYIDAISLNLERRYQWSNNPFEKLIVRGELGRMKRYELFIKTQSSKAIITSPADKEFLHSRRVKEVDIVPNYIDLSYFHRNLSENRMKALVFTGTMDYAPNVDAAKRLVKEIYLPLKAKNPDLECWLVGANPAADIKKLNNIPGVVVTGFVEDIRPWQWKAAVYVCPLRFGAGQQNKILEAAGLGCPIVMSTITNSGIGFTHQEEAFVCEHNEEFIKEIERLLNDHELAGMVTAKASDFVSEHFSQKKVGDQLVSAYTAS